VRRLRTQISVSGFAQHEVDAGLADLVAEFEQRPWLLAAHVSWDAQRRRLVVVIEREGESLALQDGGTGATLDEVWDCVVACIRSENGLHFDVDFSAFV